jgi:hypothetical protein
MQEGTIEVDEMNKVELMHVDKVQTTNLEEIEEGKDEDEDEAKVEAEGEDVVDRMGSKVDEIGSKVDEIGSKVGKMGSKVDKMVLIQMASDGQPGTQTAVNPGAQIQMVVTRMAISNRCVSNEIRKSKAVLSMCLLLLYFLKDSELC